MNRADEIKIYNTKEEIEADFDNFRSRWQYDADRSAGTHDTGIGMRKQFVMNGLKVVFTGLQEWAQNMEDAGLDQQQRDAYLRMLKNQFVILTEKESPRAHELTIEERVKELEKVDKWKVEMAREYHHFSEEKIQQLEERLRLRREKMLREGGWYGSGSDR